MVVCSFKGIGRKFSRIVKDIVEDLSLLFKICNIFVVMINCWNTNYFLMKAVFNNGHYVFGLVLESINLFEIRE